MILRNGYIDLDIKQHKLMVHNQEKIVGKKVFALLKFFLENQGRAMKHEEILTAVWGRAFKEETQYLRVTLGQLNKVIGKGIIKNVIGIGYRMDILPSAETKDETIKKAEKIFIDEYTKNIDALEVRTYKAIKAVLEFFKIL